MRTKRNIEPVQPATPETPETIEDLERKLDRSKVDMDLLSNSLVQRAEALELAVKDLNRDVWAAHGLYWSMKSDQNRIDARRNKGGLK